MLSYTVELIYQSGLFLIAVKIKHYIRLIPSVRVHWFVFPGIFNVIQHCFRISGTFFINKINDSLGVMIPPQRCEVVFFRYIFPFCSNKNMWSLIELGTVTCLFLKLSCSH